MLELRSGEATQQEGVLANRQRALTPVVVPVTPPAFNEERITEQQEDQFINL